ncbi:hypothetical protein RRG08_025619 [Elysia crispata]|uniref:Uncharacterized protein n=1 Tax=Elysia crispata TaxID=231223 RepID=A0AAE1CXT5_9GAST|nr:hypothetical protein RRG08_025619 [Elysia crispata]
MTAVRVSSELRFVKCFRHSTLPSLFCVDKGNCRHVVDLRQVLHKMAAPMNLICQRMAISRLSGRNKWLYGSGWRCQVAGGDKKWEKRREEGYVGLMEGVWGEIRDIEIQTRGMG